jgi:hypothetical protein
MVDLSELYPNSLQVQVDEKKSIPEQISQLVSGFHLLLLLHQS